MTEIYLIRHGQTLWNLDHRFQGKTNTPLTAQGRLEAEELANRLERIPFETVFSSPLDRAKETAQIIAKAQNTPFSVKDTFCEISFGEWEGYTYNEIKTFTPWIDEWFLDPSSHKIPQGDDLTVEMARLRNVLVDLGHQYQNKRIAIVAHAGILRLALLCSLGLPLSYYCRFVLSNTSFTVLQYDENVFKLAVLNDYSHLSNR